VKKQTVELVKILFFKKTVFIVLIILQRISSV